jgi:lipopolysaccharide export LptBFGC system permease protein LptF
MDTLAVIISVVGGLIVIATALVSMWVIPLYRKLSVIHAAIRAKNDEIDSVEQILTAGLRVL